MFLEELAHGAIGTMTVFPPECCRHLPRYTAGTRPEPPSLLPFHPADPLRNQPRINLPLRKEISSAPPDRASRCRTPFSRVDEDTMKPRGHAVTTRNHATRVVLVHAGVSPFSSLVVHEGTSTARRRIPRLCSRTSVLIAAQSQPPRRFICRYRCRPHAGAAACGTCKLRLTPTVPLDVARFRRARHAGNSSTRC